VKPALQIQAQLDWFERHGVTRFDLAVQRRSGSWMPQDLGLPRPALERCLPWCRAENAQGGNVYVRPYRHGAWHVVFLDDVALADADALANAHSALVVETSPNRCHVWIHTEAPLAERDRYLVQKALAARPNANGHLADPASVSGDHWGRLAGFRNRKTGRDCWVNLRRASGALPPLRTEGFLVEGAPGRFSPTEGGSVVGKGLASAGPGRASSESEREWALVMRRLEQGDAPAEVEAWLADLARTRRGDDVARYARLTVTKAFRLITSRHRARLLA